MRRAVQVARYDEKVLRADIEGHEARIVALRAELARVVARRTDIETDLAGDGEKELGKGGDDER